MFRLSASSSCPEDSGSELLRASSHRQGRCGKQLSEQGLHFQPLCVELGPCYWVSHWTRSRGDASHSQDAVLKEAPGEPPCFLSSFTCNRLQQPWKMEYLRAGWKDLVRGLSRSHQTEKSWVPESLLCDPKEPSNQGHLHWILCGQESTFNV